MTELLLGLILWWSPTSPDITDGYRVYVGHESRSYYTSFDVGLDTSMSLYGLLDDGGIFVAVTAYNKHSESVFSEELYIESPTSVEEETYEILSGYTFELYNILGQKVDINSVRANGIYFIVTRNRDGKIENVKKTVGIFGLHGRIE